MSNSSKIDRKEQARLEVGRTKVAAPVALTLVALFLLMVAGPPLVELGSDLLGGRPSQSEPHALAAIAELRRGARAALGELALRHPRAANKQLRDAIGKAEHGLEEDSLIRRKLRAPVQRLLTSLLGLGNEQSYLGREGWLFFRPDVDYSVGRGFLDAGELERRRRDVDSPSSIRPDPVPALLRF
ncbi:MAG: hypothetical protein OES47_07410, partial [Acidobacteriota bacterium]|nr:hypothetical protein [Acidobacteriota bacterium]